MNVVLPPSTAASHPFLTGKPKRLVIDAPWVEAASGKGFATHPPFGGHKMGGDGRESGQQPVEEDREVKAVQTR